MDVISLNPPQKDDTDWEIDPVSDIEDYTIEKAQEILKRAEARLLEQAAAGDPKSGTQDSSSSRFRIPKLHANGVPEPYVQTDGDVARAEPARLIRKEHRELANRVRKVEDPVVVKRTVIEKKKATAGSDWFNLPRTDLTPELKRDIQLLKMRSVLDPKRHYKKEGKSKAPEFSQVGTIVEGPAEYYSARLLNRERKKTFVEEILAAEAETGRFKQKYNEVQTTKRSGKKAYYKDVKAKRSAKWKK